MATVLSVMPVWFLKPLQLPAFAPPVAEFTPVPSVAPPPPVEPVDPPAVVEPVESPPPPVVEPVETPSPPVVEPVETPAPPTPDPPAWATVSGSSREPQAARLSATSAQAGTRTARRIRTTMGLHGARTR